LSCTGGDIELIDTVEELKEYLTGVLVELAKVTPVDEKLLDETKFLIHCCEVNDNILFS